MDSIGEEKFEIEIENENEKINEKIKGDDDEGQGFWLFGYGYFALLFSLPYFPPSLSPYTNFPPLSK